MPQRAFPNGHCSGLSDFINNLYGFLLAGILLDFLPSVTLTSAASHLLIVPLFLSRLSPSSSSNKQPQFCPHQLFSIHSVHFVLDSPATAFSSWKISRTSVASLANSIPVNPTFATQTSLWNYRWLFSTTYRILPAWTFVRQKLLIHTHFSQNKRYKELSLFCLLYYLLLPLSQCPRLFSGLSCLSAL